MSLSAAELFDWPDSLERFRESFDSSQAPWSWVDAIKEALALLDSSIPEGLPPGLKVEGPVWIDPSARLPHVGTILGPAWIGPECELRPGVFVRGNVIAGRGCVLGNACEFKNCLLLDGVEAPHFNYVGDSILGNRAHLGAGVICANLRMDRKPVEAYTPGGREETGLRKLGAILGDGAEAGCHAVLQPGTILGRRAVVMSGIAFAGYVEPGMIAAAKTEVRKIPRPDG